MTEDAFARRVTRLGALADPVRRRLYRYVAEQGDAVSRDQAADGVELPRHTAKFHLERLVDEGLLVAEFRRLTGRSGPGAGRPAKLYRRSQQEVAVSVPARRYDLAGRLFADALQRTLDGTPVADAVRDAVDHAARVVVAAYPANGRKPVRRLAQVLAELGYEPREEDESLELGNCPFVRLVDEHQPLVCRLNREFVGAVAGDLACPSAVVSTEPEGHGCCVRVEPSRS